MKSMMSYQKSNGAKSHVKQSGLFGKHSVNRNLFERSELNKVIINVKMFKGGRMINGLDHSQREKLISQLQI